MVKAATLNVNYGYVYDLVPSRTHHRQWQEAQERVESAQTRLNEQSEAISYLQTQFEFLVQQDNEQRADLKSTVDAAQAELETRRQAEGPSIAWNNVWHALNKLWNNTPTAFNDAIPGCSANWPTIAPGRIG